jgi:hypothetical protein
VRELVVADEGEDVEVVPRGDDPRVDAEDVELRLELLEGQRVVQHVDDDRRQSRLAEGVARERGQGDGRRGDAERGD